MKLMLWIFAGISAVTAATAGIVSFVSGSSSVGNILTSTDSASSGSNLQTAPVNNNDNLWSVNLGAQISGSDSVSVNRSKRSSKNVYENLNSYRRCREYTIREKCISLVPEDSEIRNFLI